MPPSHADLHLVTDPFAAYEELNEQLADAHRAIEYGVNDLFSYFGYAVSLVPINEVGGRSAAAENGYHLTIARGRSPQDRQLVFFSDSESAEYARGRLIHNKVLPDDTRFPVLHDRDTNTYRVLCHIEAGSLQQIADNIVKSEADAFLSRRLRNLLREHDTILQGIQRLRAQYDPDGHFAEDKRDVYNQLLRSQVGRNYTIQSMLPGADGSVRLEVGIVSGIGVPIYESLGKLCVALGVPNPRDEYSHFDSYSDVVTLTLPPEAAARLAAGELASPAQAGEAGRGGVPVTSR